MKIKRHTLNPVRLALPGLLAVSAWGSWTPSGDYSGAGFSSTANTLGSTQAKYDQSGISITAIKHAYGFDRALGFKDEVPPTRVSGTLITVSYTWSETTWSQGVCDLTKEFSSDHGHAEVDSNI